METLVTTDPQVDADDPVLWADPRDPARAVLFGDFWEPLEATR